MRRLLALVLTAVLLAGSAGAVWSDAGDHWAGEALERAGSRGWLSGYEDGTVRPDDALTWGHYLTMLGRAFWPDALAQTPPEAEGGHWASGARAAAEGAAVEDMGCDSPDDPIYYPYVAAKACQAIIDSGYTKEGVLICGTGLGMAMTANKFKGIRAGVCHDIFSAERLKLSNDGNVICMGERVIGTELAKRILEKWLELEFVDCASTSKVEAIKEIEGENLK